MAKAPTERSSRHRPLGTIRPGEAWTLIIQPLVGEYLSDDFHGRVAKLRRKYLERIHRTQKTLLKALNESAGYTHLVLWLDDNDEHNERDSSLSLIVDRVQSFLQSVAAGRASDPFLKISLDGSDGLPIGGGVVLLREDALRWALRSCGSKPLARIADLPIEQIEDQEQLAVVSALTALTPRALRTFVESCIGTELTSDWPAAFLGKGLVRLLDEIGERHAKVREIAGIMNLVARRVATEESELVSSAAAEVPGDDLVRLGAFFQDAAKRRYRDEVFGRGPLSVSRFNAWIRAEVARQAESEATDERKRFVTNAIQHFVRENGWRLTFDDDGASDTPCTLATGPHRNGRRYYVRQSGADQGVIATRTNLPNLSAHR